MVERKKIMISTGILLKSYALSCGKGYKQMHLSYGPCMLYANYMYYTNRNKREKNIFFYLNFVYIHWAKTSYSFRAEHNVDMKLSLIDFSQ